MIFTCFLIFICLFMYIVAAEKKVCNSKDDMIHNYINCFILKNHQTKLGKSKKGVIFTMIMIFKVNEFFLHTLNLSNEYFTPAF